MSGKLADLAGLFLSGIAFDGRTTAGSWPVMNPLRQAQR